MRRWSEGEKLRFCYYNCTLASPLSYTADRLTIAFQRPVTEDELRIVRNELRLANEFPSPDCKYKRNFPPEKIDMLFDLFFYDGCRKLTAVDMELFRITGLTVDQSLNDPYGNKLDAETVRWIYWCMKYEGASHFSTAEQIQLDTIYHYDARRDRTRGLTLDDLARQMNILSPARWYERREIAFQLKSDIEKRTFDRKRWPTSDRAVAHFNSLDNGPLNLFWHGKYLMYESRART